MGILAGGQVTPRGITKRLSHGYDALLARSVPSIPQLIERGIHRDSIEKQPGLMSHIFANKIRLDGQEHVVASCCGKMSTATVFTTTSWQK